MMMKGGKYRACGEFFAFEKLFPGREYTPLGPPKDWAPLANSSGNESYLPQLNFKIQEVLKSLDGVERINERHFAFLCYIAAAAEIGVRTVEAMRTRRGALREHHKIFGKRYIKFKREAEQLLYSFPKGDLQLEWAGYGFEVPSFDQVNALGLQAGAVMKLMNSTLQELQLYSEELKRAKADFPELAHNRFDSNFWQEGFVQGLAAIWYLLHSKLPSEDDNSSFADLAQTACWAIEGPDFHSRIIKNAIRQIKSKELDRRLLQFAESGSCHTLEPWEKRPLWPCGLGHAKVYRTLKGFPDDELDWSRLGSARMRWRRPKATVID